MKMLVGLVALTLALAACDFSEYAQSENIVEDIDDYRTGCEINTDALLTGYKQYEANRFHVDTSFGRGEPDPTPTPGPTTSEDIATTELLEKAWENGCQTGRRDAAGAKQATIMSLRDALTLLEKRISELELEVIPTPTATPTP